MENSDKLNTSRTSFFDLVDGIIQLTAVASHDKEVYLGERQLFIQLMKDLAEMNNGEIEATEEEMQDTKREAMQAAGKAEIFDKLKSRANNLRRKLMRTLWNEFGTGEKNHKAWCSFKHAATAFAAISDQYDSEDGTVARDDVVDAFELMIEHLSILLGVRHETCLRCLEDMLQNPESN
jgi:actin-related protein